MVGSHESSRTTSEPPGSYALSWLFPFQQGWEIESSYETGGSWEKLNRGVSKPGGFPIFSGKVQIVSRTLSGLFLVGALNRPRKRKSDESGKSPDHPRADRENPGKIPKRIKKDKKGRMSPDRETPPFETPRLAALGWFRCRSRTFAYTQPCLQIRC